MWGVNTHVYKPKSNTACTTALKKNLKTRGSASSLLRILIILFHISLACDKFHTTSCQSSSAADITRPSYRTEVTISMG